MNQDALARELSRRTFMHLMGAAGLVTVGGSLLTPGRALAAPTIGDLTGLRGAMHVHTSFSEGSASCTASWRKRRGTASTCSGRPTTTGA